jgi:hypothetical protein
MKWLIIPVISNPVQSNISVYNNTVKNMVEKNSQKKRAPAKYFKILLLIISGLIALYCDVMSGLSFPRYIIDLLIILYKIL